MYSTDGFLVLFVFLFFFQSEVFAVAFALLAAGAVILTLNVLLLVIFSPSLCLLMYEVFVSAEFNFLKWKSKF